MQEYKITNLTSLSHHQGCRKVRPQVFRPCCCMKTHKACYCYIRYFKKSSKPSRTVNKKKQKEKTLSQQNSSRTHPPKKKNLYTVITNHHSSQGYNINKRIH